ncbi:uncharacterized protein BT62DRAFT_454678 [Guyanagaster necrorhizus]|uniref:Uncharacterized protein n=1 Tax=Guyanagaster necrorhizus TaxID=856835 RepID=A0A9P8AN90_9AGAR|nr:uncharacterized protein BT62DRAFT_454678 [Guyanagaster necrorhizus MCA 3950]KAG7442068.1 hypothetical protein BT62DRAFT_454678 [Guyanagaster necrorhizus MCA 3950]
MAQQTIACRLLHRPVPHHRTPKSPLFIHYRSIQLSRHIQTLNPKALTSLDFRDISGRKTDIAFGPQLRYFWDNHRKKNLPFPSSTTGFYYYWTHSDLPATAGQVRFCVTPTMDPSLFETGSDLRKPDGMPWCISMSNLLCLRGSVAAQILLNDGLVSQDLISSKYFYMHQKYDLHNSSALLESFYDVFPVSLPRLWLPIHMMSSDGVKCMSFKLGDHSWIESLKLAEPGKQVYAHLRLHLRDNHKRPDLQVVRIFSPSGAQLDSDFPLITTSKWSGGVGVFEPWYLRSRSS